MLSFVPEFEGEMTFDPLPDDFVPRLRIRVESGLLSPGRRARADYVVHSTDRDAISFGAEGLLTAYNIGLNEVTVQRMGNNQLHYRVTFWRWTWAAVVQGLALGVLLAVLALTLPAVRREFSEPWGGALLSGAIAGFFCLLWPWLLTAMHRGPAEQALRRILRETLSGTSARAA